MSSDFEITIAIISGVFYIGCMLVCIRCVKKTRNLLPKQDSNVSNKESHVSNTESHVPKQESYV